MCILISSVVHYWKTVTCVTKLKPEWLRRFVRVAICFILRMRISLRLQIMPLDDEDSDDGLDIFVEPDGYFEPEKPFTYEEYQLRDGRTLNLRLVGHNPLWVSLGNLVHC